MSHQPLALAIPPELVDAIATRVVELMGRPEVAGCSSSSPWLDVESAATYMACKPARVYDLVSQGRLEAGRDGRRLVFHRDDLDAYLRGRGATA